MVDRKNEFEIIQKIIEEWITKYQKNKKDIWSDNLISTRIISWISNADLILKNNRKDFNQILGLLNNKELIKTINLRNNNKQPVSIGEIQVPKVLPKIKYTLKSLL